MEALAPMFEAVNWPHESLKDSHEDGCTEPWLAEIIASIVKAKRPERVVELGGFKGTTTAWIACAMDAAGGGSLYVSEPDEARREAIFARLGELPLHRTVIAVSHVPSPQIIAQFDDKSIDIAWVDNDHQKHHVEQEIVALWPKMKPGGIMLFHDVWGSTDLQTVVKKYGGVSLDLPRLGPAGGLGIISIPRG